MQSVLGWLFASLSVADCIELVKKYISWSRRKAVSFRRGGCQSNGSLFCYLLTHGYQQFQVLPAFGYICHSLVLTLDGGLARDKRRWQESGMEAVRDKDVEGG